MGPLAVLESCGLGLGVGGCKGDQSSHLYLQTVFTAFWGLPQGPSQGSLVGRTLRCTPKNVYNKSQRLFFLL